MRQLLRCAIKHPFRQKARVIENTGLLETACWLSLVSLVVDVEKMARAQMPRTQFDLKFVFLFTLSRERKSKELPLPQINKLACSFLTQTLSNRSAFAGILTSPTTHKTFLGLLQSLHTKHTRATQNLCFDRGDKPVSSLQTAVQ